MLKVVLVEPEIPWNAGNVGRTCAAAGAQLHLVGPLGFSLSERRLRRAGMDYWERCLPRVHASWEEFLERLPSGADLAAFSPDGARSLWDASFSPDCWLLFGSESRGLPARARAFLAGRLHRIPMRPGERSLNLSTAAAVALYEASRRLGRWDAGPSAA